MLRAFRRFIRKESLSLRQLNEVKSLPVHLQGIAIAERLNLPTDLATEPKYLSGLILLFFSHSYTRRKQLVQPVYDYVAPFLREISPIFSEVFNGNKLQYRQMFFRDPLIQFLWRRF